jgi:anti-sigma regulatory factor (Ser/Thr protein kinase)
VSGALERRFTLTELAAVRHEVERFGARHGLAELALYRFVVAVNELTTNAVRHGGGAGRLELRRLGDVLRCRVIDEGPGLPADRRRIVRAPAQALSGRGLWLARQIAASLDIDTGPSGTSITLTSHLA